MPKIKKTLLVPFSAQQMYDLINDIEAYPEYLPWCKKAKIHTQAETQLEATLYIGKGLVKQTISTFNTMIPNIQIKMQYKAGPFKHCDGAWNFIATQDNMQCQVEFDINYEFSNAFTAMTIEPLFNPITTTLIDSFYKRAQEIYGTDNKS